MSELYGSVVCVNPKGHAFIRDGETLYLALTSNVAEDEVGRRYFILNEECTFEYMANHKNPHGKPLAINIVPLNREPVDVKSHAELCTLTEWDGQKGSARRLGTVNDQLWIRASEILTEGIETLRVGSQLWCKVSKPAKSGQRWLGREIEICMESVTP
jgi:hypothetical protein